jgi:hypothetical protein
MNEKSHPLDNSDPDQCYAVMMSERTTLITAKRESEDNLIKTVVQLSSAMIVLAAGLANQLDLIRTQTSLALFTAGLIVLSLSILAAVGEQRLSAKGYERQVEEVVAFYTKNKSTIEIPKINAWIERAMNLSLGLFVVGLAIVAIFAINLASEQRHGPTAQQTSK